MGNDMFANGSIERKHIAALIAYRATAEKHLQRWAQKRISNAQDLGDATGCRPRHLLVGLTKAYMVPLLDGSRTRKNKKGKFRLTPQKIIAIYKPAEEGGLSDSDMWKVVAPLDQGGPQAGPKLFNVSARCNVFGSSEHCCEPSHCNIETARRNTIRKSHHAGWHGCFCELECLGPKVTRLRWTDKDRQAYICSTPGCMLRNYTKKKCLPCSGIAPRTDIRASPERSRNPDNADTAHDTCGVEHCSNGIGTNEYCYKHIKVRAHEDCDTRIKSDATHCVTHKYSECGAEDCSARVQKNVYCPKHSKACAHEGCDRRIGSKGTRCNHHMHGGRTSQCAYDGCTTHPNVSAEYFHCHFKACSEPGCTERVNRQTHNCLAHMKQHKVSRNPNGTTTTT